MTQSSSVKIYVSLLEEGTPTLRPTEAEDLGGRLYKIIPTPEYNPESEIWEFPPGSVVVGRESHTDKGEKILWARRTFVSADEIVRRYEGRPIVEIVVKRYESDDVQTNAIDIGVNGLYAILPTPDYDPMTGAIWEFSPGSIVRCVTDKNAGRGPGLLAFDQIREDMIDDEYARLVFQKN